MSAALVTSLPGIRWFSKGEILSIVKATFLAVPLDTGIAGTTPSLRLSISTTSSSFGPRFLSAITVSTFTRLWLVIGPSLESCLSKKIQEGYFGAFSLLLQVSTNQPNAMDYDRVNRYWGGGRPDIPSR